MSLVATPAGLNTAPATIEFAHSWRTRSIRRDMLQVLVALLLLDSLVHAVVYEPHTPQRPANTAQNSPASASQPSSSLATAATAAGNSTAASSPSSRHVAWGEAAFSYLKSLDCDQVFFTTERECRQLREVAKSAIAVYTAGPTVAGRLAAVLPDGGLARAGVHDGFVVLDPYPTANFGHLVLAFHVALHAQRSACDRDDGIFLPALGDCLVLALKRRCKNALERRWRRRNFARRCEINFLPLVHLETDREVKRQLLQCRKGLAGFGACPRLRPLNETSGLFCNPLRENTKRCETARERVHTRCRVFEICDQAVLLSGGWSRQAALPHHVDNAAAVYRMLRLNGFKRRNIKLFFANGIDGGIAVPGEPAHEVYPAALKMAMRYHIQKMCSSPHCVDSLLLYLNGPAKSDGTILLWDVDGDGIAGQKERYSLEELLADLSDCQARQVQVVADQSYSGEVSRAVRRSRHHRNVVVFASSRDHEYSWGSDFTRHWTSTNHTHKCAQQVFKESRKKMSLSSPEIAAGEDVVNMTIFGAPCDVMPPFNYRELHQNYLGCQNLPTALWVIKFLSATQNSPVVDDADPTTETETRDDSAPRGT